MKRLTIALLAIVLTTTVTDSTASAKTYSEIVAFGASLTDSGNVAVVSPDLVGFSVPPSPPYYMSRFTNGPNWLDILADSLGVERPLASLAGGTNYAYSGATTGSIDNPFGFPNVDDQVATYLGERTPTGDELIILVGSGNDFGFGQTNAEEPVQFVRQAVADLAAAGAKEILVASLLGEGEPIRSTYHELLSVELQTQRLTNDGLTIHEFDIDTVVENIIANAAEFGITELDRPACEDCGAGDVEFPMRIADNPNEFLLWDSVHWTTPVHAVIGQEAALVVVSEPSTGLLFLAGLLAILTRRNSTCVRPAGA